MTDQAIPTRAAAGRLGVRVAQLFLLVALCARLWVSFTLPPIGDEAYYFMWGQKLGWSYFDHPPLHAWLMGLVAHIFGWNLVSLRLLTWLTLAGTLAIFWDWSKRLSPADPGRWFWPSAAIYVASPLFFLMSGVAFHDHLLIFLSLLSGTLFLRYAEAFEADRSGQRFLYAGAVALGLAVLTKYNGVLVGLALALFILARRPLRPSLATPHPWLAALLAVAMQAPVFWWNMTAGLASYKFHLTERWGGSIAFDFDRTGRFLIVAAEIVSPLMLPVIVLMIVRPLRTPFADRARQLALAAFATSSLAMTGMSLFVEVFFYWNVTAFVFLMPLLVGWMRTRILFGLHLLYGLVWIVLIVIRITPSLGMMSSFPIDWTTASIFGWNAVSDEIEKLREEHPVDFVATTRYTTAAQLGFAMHDADITAISDRHDQYDYWFDAPAHEGQSALVVTDPYLGLIDVEPHFDRLDKLADVPFSVFGVTVYTPSIYLGTGFHAAPKAP